MQPQMETSHSREYAVEMLGFGDGTLDHIGSVTETKAGRRTLASNDKDQPVAAIDLPCEKPPTPTRLHLIVILRSLCTVELTSPESRLFLYDAPKLTIRVRIHHGLRGVKASV